MRQRILRSVGMIALIVALFSLLTLSVAAQTPPYITLVSDPSVELENVYYCEGKDTVKRDPDDFLWQDGKDGQKALTLNGNDQYLRIATAQVKKLSAFTFSSWVKWSGEGGNTLLTFYRNENYCISVSMRGEKDTDGLTMKWILPDRDPIILTKTAAEGSSFAFPANEWHHLAVVASSSEFTLYVDGARYLSQAVAVDFEDMRLDKFRIGAGLTPKPAIGASFQNARLYTGTLTADQVALLAQDCEPDSNATITTGPLATRPSSPVTSPSLSGGVSEGNGDDGASTLLGLPVGMVILLGGIVLLVVALSVFFSIQGKKKEGDQE